MPSLSVSLTTHYSLLTTHSHHSPFAIRYWPLLPFAVRYSLFASSLELKRVERLKRLPRRHLIRIDFCKQGEDRLNSGIGFRGCRIPRHGGKQRQILEAAAGRTVLGFE